jgi:SNF2 family DNA or RNA helicase
MQQVRQFTRVLGILFWQVSLYGQLLKSSAVASLLMSLDGASYSTALSGIMAMRKLCNHPDLLFVADADAASDIEAALRPLYPPDFCLGQSQHSGAP